MIPTGNYGKRSNYNAFPSDAEATYKKPRIARDHSPDVAMEDVVMQDADETNKRSADTAFSADNRQIDGNISNLAKRLRTEPPIHYIYQVSTDRGRTYRQVDSLADAEAIRTRVPLASFVLNISQMNG